MLLYGRALCIRLYLFGQNPRGVKEHHGVQTTFVGNERVVATPPTIEFSTGPSWHALQAPPRTASC